MKSPLKHFVLAAAAAASMTAGAAGSTTPAEDRKPVVVFIATGGTIAMKIDPVTKGVVPAISGDDLMQSVPDAPKYARIEVDNFAKISSNHLTDTYWASLTERVEKTLQRPEVAGVVIAQGTDTMEETAWWLDLTIRSDKPVVMIGAQRNASSSDFDGPRNLLNAIRIATTPEARGRGVMVAMNNQINAARSVTKTHTANVETFQGGTLGLIGEVWDDKVVISRQPLRRMHIPITASEFPAVHIFPMYVGADGAFIRHAVDTGTKGIVVQAVGMGNMNVSMFEAVKYALSRNVPVVISTRVHNGRTMPVYGFEGGGKTTHDAGAIMAGDLNPPKAKILLTLLLQQGTVDRTRLAEAFAQ